MPKVDIDTAYIENLAELLARTGLTEIEICQGDARIRVARQVATSVEYVHARAGTGGERGPRRPRRPSPSRRSPHPGTITSPMVGTAYLFPEPGAAAVRQGRRRGQGRADAADHRGDEGDELDPRAQGRPRGPDLRQQRGAGRVWRAAAGHRVGCGRVQEGPDRQSRRDRLAHPARLPRAEHRRGGRALDRRFPGHACPPRRRERVHRSAQGLRELPEPAGAAGRRRDHRCGGDPSRATASCRRMPTSPRWSRSTASSSSAPRPSISGSWATRSSPRPPPRNWASRPCRAATGRCGSEAEAIELAHQIGFPVLIKAVAGGGGRGMTVVRHEDELGDAVRMSRNEARAAFGDDRVYVERFLDHPRHIEVQVIGDGKGRVVASGRARLLAAATAPEGGRGGPLARARRRAARAAGHTGGGGAAQAQLPQPRHGRVPLSGRPVLLHRDEHAASGRAPGDRADHRRGLGARADQARGRRAARLHAEGRALHRARDRGAHQRRGSAHAPAHAGQGARVPCPGRTRGADGFRTLCRLHRAAVLRQPDRQADRPRHRSARRDPRGWSAASRRW